ncbi:hypothetical protein ACF05W_21170 [Streptomyces lydicus]|uniref:hypothetical protein n=1 Tax=Streptomyces lydicus TaxID=47763 RepID=UPI003700B327
MHAAAQLGKESRSGPRDMCVPRAQALLDDGLNRSPKDLRRAARAVFGSLVLRKDG